MHFDHSPISLLSFGEIGFELFEDFKSDTRANILSMKKINIFMVKAFVESKAESDLF